MPITETTFEVNFNFPPNAPICCCGDIEPPDPPIPWLGLFWKPAAETAQVWDWSWQIWSGPDNGSSLWACRGNAGDDGQAECDMRDAGPAACAPWITVNGDPDDIPTVELEGEDIRLTFNEYSVLLPLAGYDHYPYDGCHPFNSVDMPYWIFDPNAEEE